MKVAGGGFEQSYNAQAAVAEAMLVVATSVTQACNDMQQVKPLLQIIGTHPATLGKVEQLLADTGYCSKSNIAACEAAQIEPFIAVAREDHHPGWRERLGEPEPLAADATPLKKMAHKLKTQKGRKVYALRKQTVEPVFGIIKSVMGFRQFLLRGIEKVTGEWTLVCLAWNLKRMAVLRQKSVQCT
jgi:IS5 family transposase